MKTLKTHIVKFITIVVSILYILMPMHEQIKSGMHSISHNFKMPDVILSHNLNENVSNKQSVKTISFHEHKIIDVLDFFIEVNTDNKDSNKPNLIVNSVDKHFHSSKYKALKLVSIKSQTVEFSYREKIKDGFYKKVNIPPKTKNLQLT